jgi:hypothetical protein
MTEQNFPKYRQRLNLLMKRLSNYPDFAAWLVRQGIDSISLNPDNAIKTAFVIAEEEAAQAQAAAA